SSGLVFFGENSGAFVAADAANGKVLWQFQTNQTWKASPMTYVFDNKQYIAIAVGQSMMAFGLPEEWFKTQRPKDPKAQRGRGDHGGGPLVPQPRGRGGRPHGPHAFFVSLCLWVFVFIHFFSVRM